MAMKKITFVIILSILLVGIGNAQTTGTTDLDQGLQLNGYLAKDSVIVGTKYSHILYLNSTDGQTEKNYVNFLAGAHILVGSRQTADSITSLVYLQVGQDLTGTEGTDFVSVFIDTLINANTTFRIVKYVNIDLTPYLQYKQARVKVTAITGVAVGGRNPYWSAIIGAQGKLGKLTDRTKAASVIH